jgi:hypothetical protein
MTTATVSSDPQMALEEVILTDPELEAAVQRYLNTLAVFRDHQRSKRIIRDRLPTLEEGRRFRVAGKLIVVKKRAGGGFSIPPWESLSPIITNG